MSGRRVMLHIGTEKTGSTAIQSFLASNREALAQQGYLYSRIPNATNHTAMVAFAVDAEKDLDLHRHNKVTPATQSAFREEVSRQLSSELDSGHIVTISNEHLSSKANDSVEIERVATLFAELGAEVDVIIYLRRLVPMMEASYSTFVKYWRTQPFVFRQEVDRQARYDLHALVERWEAAFPGRVHVRLYREEWKQQPSELLRDFLEALGIDVRDDFIVPERSENPSLAREATELLRLINVALASAKTPTKGMVRHQFIREAEKGSIGPPFALTAEESAEVMSIYGPSIEALRSRIGDEPVDYLLSNAGSRRDSEPTPVSDDERENAIGILLTAADRALAQQVETVVTQQVDELSRARDTAMAERDASLTDRDAARHDLAIARAELDAGRQALADLQHERDTARNALARAHDELDRTRFAVAELSRVTATRTWRWTAPARSGFARLRRRFAHRRRL